MKYICVYCGSSTGKGEKYLNNAKLLGETLAKESIGLVYGGSENGTMGAIATACLNAGGKVIGVSSKDLLEGETYREKIQAGLTEVIIAKNLTERKCIMLEKSDAIIALPGGMGTIEETLEAMNEHSLGYHNKPIGLVNTDGYYEHLKLWFIHAKKEGFMYHITEDTFIYEEDPVTLVNKIKENI